MAFALRQQFYHKIDLNNFRFYCKNTVDECKPKYKIVLVRHGESEWNLKNLFCGWFDAALSDNGLSEASSAGKSIRKAKLEFDVAHTSLLKRAIDTLKVILLFSRHKKIPIQRTWRLNERHYGGLTGLNKAETAKKFGEEKVQIWRRSFDIPPPPMEKNHKYYDVIRNDPRYCENGPKPEEFPQTESLKLTIDRTLPYWNDVIEPQIREGKNVLVVAHGNSLRGVVKHLEDISEEDIMGINIPTGIPFVYELDECIKPVGKMRFLGDPEKVKKAMESVAKQGKAK